MKKFRLIWKKVSLNGSDVHMRATTIVFALLVLVAAMRCESESPENTTPDAAYPSVAEQRQQLAGKAWVTPTRILDSSQIIADLVYFSSDVCTGRLPGTAGHAAARERILWRMRGAGVDSFSSSLVQSFPSTAGAEVKNVIGWIRGTTHPEKYIVLSAHYDHLGKHQNGSTYYGADDNASGVACLLALASYFRKNGHPYSLIFAAFDKEEAQLEGAYRFVNDRVTQGSLQQIRCNLNMDMIARSDNNEIFVSGIRHAPQFLPLVRELQSKANVRLLMGHDGLYPEQDWTGLSDHAAFHQRQVPFLYLGVEDHADYHQPTDTHDRIHYGRFIENCNIIALMAAALRP